MSEPDLKTVLTQIANELVEMNARLAKIEAFTEATTEAVAPFLSGKGAKWLALVAKTKRGT